MSATHNEQGLLAARVGAAIAFAALCLLVAFSYRLFVIATPSMEPAYSVNTLVVVRKAPYREVAAGDVIAYRSDALNGKTAFHRVVEVTDGGEYLTKGDNSEAIDGAPVTQSAYLGKAVYATDAFSVIMPFIRSGYFRMLIAVCVSGGLAVFVLTRKRFG